MKPKPLLREVFVVGGLPRVTYVPRDELMLEQRLNDYLDERFKILSLTGPTKSGKTVLVRRIIPEALIVPGGSIETADDFWAVLVDLLRAYPEETREKTMQDSVTDTKALDVGVNAVVTGGFATSEATAATDTKRQALSRTRPNQQVALDALSADRDRVLFIDDFHYIPSDVQAKIVRALKAPVFDGTPVIVAAVPHRAYDTVRVEKEMTGRVQTLDIPLWKERELREIANQGFAALNVAGRSGDIQRLARESFGSPLLMQEFCFHFCKEAGVTERRDKGFLVQPPTDFAEFFAARGTAASKTAFDLLAQGPRQRSDRKQRRYANGGQGEIYEVVLSAIAATGPRTELPYDELRAKLREILAGEPPQRHEVTRVLDEITKIARRIEGEPVIEYDEEYDTVYISDPFFAFFLRWRVANGLD